MTHTHTHYIYIYTCCMLNINSCPCRVCPQDGSTDRSCRSANTIKRKRPNEMEAPILLSGRPGLVVRAHDTHRVRTCMQCMRLAA